jgi:hypothetical protein
MSVATLHARLYRRRHTGQGFLLTVGLAVTVALFGIAVSPSLAYAAGSGGDTSVSSVTVIQTSPLENLAPGVAPAAITGQIINNSPDSIFITAVTVEITSVTRDPGSVAGACDASDYTLLDSRMSVERTLAAVGGSTTFSGASLGFNNKSVNQDACQRATVQLLYTALSSPAPLANTGGGGGVALMVIVGVASLVVGVGAAKVVPRPRPRG